MQLVSSHVSRVYWHRNKAFWTNPVEPRKPFAVLLWQFNSKNRICETKCEPSCNDTHARPALGNGRTSRKGTSTMKTERKDILCVHTFPLRLLAQSKRYQFPCFPDDTYFRSSLKNEPTRFHCTVLRTFQKLPPLCTTSLLIWRAGHTSDERARTIKEKEPRNKLTNARWVRLAQHHIRNMEERKNKKQRSLSPRGANWRQRSTLTNYLCSQQRLLAGALSAFGSSRSRRATRKLLARLSTISYEK